MQNEKFYILYFRNSNDGKLRTLFFYFDKVSLNKLDEVILAHFRWTVAE